MKHLFILLTLFLFGFDHVKSVQDSFGFIKSYYSVQPNLNYQCTTCLTYTKDLELLSLLNKEFKKTPYIKASAFIIKKSKNKTLLSTSYHVCESLKEFQTEKKFKDLGDKLMKDAFSNSLFLNTEITKQYKLRPQISVLEFDGTLHNIENIVYENLENDICFLETEDSWGREIEFAEKTCFYEKIYNISASGGFYEPSAVVLREGYVNNKVKETDVEDKNYLTAVATDSHRMSISKIRLEEKIEFEPIILPKKTIYQLCALLDGYDGDVKISNVKSKIKFELKNSILISKLIDGKFPNYIQVIPKNNQKKMETNLKSFLGSIDRVASVSLDKKDGVKFKLSNDILNLSVNNTNSGDGNESLNVKFNHDLEISFNSRYLIDVASQLDGEKIELFLNDTGSPALIKDPGDFDSIFVVMPMKG